MIDLFKEDRRYQHSIMDNNHGNCQSPQQDMQNTSSSSSTAPKYPKLQSILIDRNSSDPPSPTSTLTRNPARPIFRNHSDLGPRLRKKVTYRSQGGSQKGESKSNVPVSILKKGSVSSEPSEPDIEEMEGVFTNFQEESDDQEHVVDMHESSCDYPGNTNSSLMQDKYPFRCNTGADNTDVELGYHKKHKTNHTPHHHQHHQHNTYHGHQFNDQRVTINDVDDEGEGEDNDDDDDIFIECKLDGDGLEVIRERRDSVISCSSSKSSVESVVQAPQHNELYISESGGAAVGVHKEGR